MRLKIASRRSDLARLQAFAVAEALKNAHPGLEIEFHFSESLGDKNLTDPLWKMPGKGVFTEDLTRDLAEGRADLIVHSWKDLPVDENPVTEIVATLPRADVRDLLLFKKSSRGKTGGFRFFSSSPRREYNLTPFFRDYLPGGAAGVAFESVRGNIQTRVRKLLEDPGLDGLIVAKAAIDRLLATTAEDFRETREFLRDALGRCHFMVLPLSTNPAAPAQGALAVEIRRDRTDVRDLLAAIHHRETFLEAQEERAILKKYGGGCHQKIGATVFHRATGRLVFTRGLTDQGVELREVRWDGTAPGHPTVVRGDTLFERQRRAGGVSLGSANALFVASAFAWDEKLDFDGILWTPGLPTWKKLAEKGIWVHGCAEGLGEREDPRLSELAPNLQWASLSHGAAPRGERGPVIATYDLVPKKDAIAPVGEELHWTSAFLFDEALRRWPELKNRKHGCGPGKTLDGLKARGLNPIVRWPLAE